MSIRLTVMTKDLCRTFFQGFVNDPQICIPGQTPEVYLYQPGKADAYWQKQIQKNRIHLAIMLNQQVIGEIIFKNINAVERSCELSIHLQNDAVKNNGYGTAAELQALRFAKDELNMKTVHANTTQTNLRSQRVLKKAGFAETHKDDLYVYYAYTFD